MPNPQFLSSGGVNPATGDTLPLPSPATPGRIYQDIEASADRFPPEIYDLLTFQRGGFETSGDPLAQDFIPLSATPTWSPKDAKVFIIGVLPPSAHVTGQTLDRSATVAAVKGFAEDIDVTASATPTGGVSNGPAFSVAGYKIPVTQGPNTVGTPIQGGANGVDNGSPAIVQHSPAELYHIFHDAYVAHFKTEPTPNEVLFLVAQSMRETSGSWPNNNPGFIGNYPKPQPGTFKADGMDASGAPNKAAGTTNQYFITYDTVQSGAASFVKHAYGNANAKAAAANGDVMGYMVGLAQANYFGEPVNVYYAPFPGILQGVAGAIAAAGGPQFAVGGLPPTGPDLCAFKEDMKAYRARLGWTPDTLAGKKIPPPEVKATNPHGRFTSKSPYGEACPKDGSDPSNAEGKPDDWAKKGAEAAAKAAKDKAKLANTDLNDSELGQNLQAAQRAYIKALQISIEQMAATPPLRMLVNPISFKPSSEKIIADGSFSRGDGPVIEHWGEQQVKIAASGKLGGFYAIDVGSNPNGSPGTSPGLGRSARNFSGSYQNFLSLYLLYRNNAGIFLESFTQEKNPRVNNLAMVGSIYIFYDDVLYIGAFDSLNVTESDSGPFTLEYDFTFTVRAQFALDRVPDPLETYGNSKLFAQALPAVSTKGIQTDTSVTTPAVNQPTSPEDIAKFQALILKGEQNKTSPAAVIGLPTESSLGLSAPQPSGGDFKVTSFGQRSEEQDRKSVV